MVNDVDRSEFSCETTVPQETPTEIAKRIHSYFSYWHKWELTGVEIDKPEIYGEVLAEYNRLAKESRDGIQASSESH